MKSNNKILNPTKKDDIDKIKIFFGDNSGIQRYDFYHYPATRALERKMRGAYWNPDEVSLKNDILYYFTLPSWVRKIFEANISFQTLMDSGQNVGLDEALIPLVTSPEVEAMLKTQAYFELIHSLSYAHNLITVFPDPAKIYDSISLNKFIQHRVDKEIDVYSKLKHLQISNKSLLELIKYRLNEFSTDSDFSKKSISIISDVFSKFSDVFNKKKKNQEDKKTILEALIRINALEGLKFYVSFLMTYKINDEFGNKIPGATKIIKLINFDEDLHVVVFQLIINTLKKEEKEGFIEFFKEDEKGNSFFKTLSYQIYKETYEDEMKWADYLSSFAEIYKDTEKVDEQGNKTISKQVDAVNLLDEEEVEELVRNDWIVGQVNTLPGLTKEVMDNFMKYYTNLRLAGIGLQPLFENVKEDNTIKWFKSYKNINSERTAAQETEILSYSIGQLVNDIDDKNLEIDSKNFDIEKYFESFTKK